MAVRQDVYEERQNQLRWQVKLGDDPATEEFQDKVMQARENEWKIYKVLQCEFIHYAMNLHLPAILCLVLVFAIARIVCMNLGDVGS